MKILTLPVGEIEANCYFAWDENTKKAVCIDPGAEAENIIENVRKLGLSVTAILITHGHYDHAGALAETAKTWLCPVHMHPADLPFYFGQEKMIKAYAGGEIFRTPAAYPESPISVSPDLSFLMHHTPGHSAGCVCLEAVGQKVLFTGDTLFKDAVGRTDLPGSDEEAMARSLKMLITKFSGYTVYPGHGPATTIDEEIKNNWFLREL